MSWFWIVVLFLLLAVCAVALAWWFIDSMDKDLDGY